MARFELVLGSRANVPAMGVDLALQDAQGKRQEIQLSGAIVPLTIAALARHLAELQATLPAGHGLVQQHILVTGLNGAMLVTGELQFVVTMEGGGELALTLPREHLAAFAETVQELANLAKRRN